MNWTQVEGQWDQLKGKFQTKWGKLTDDDLEAAKGRKDILLGKLRERYGEVKDKVEQQVDDFIESL